MVSPKLRLLVSLPKEYSPSYLTNAEMFSFINVEHPTPKYTLSCRSLPMLFVNLALPSTNFAVIADSRFEDFTLEYNKYRPHEALQMRTPSQCYSGSMRPYPSRLPQISYPDHMRVSRVQRHGDITYRGRRIFVTESLHDEYIGIEQIGDDLSLLWYCDHLLGEIDHRNWKIRPIEKQTLISAASCGDKQT